MPEADDAAWCRTRGGADLSRHGRRARSLPQIQVSRGGIWADVFQVSIGRDRSERQYITLRGRDDAGDAHEAAQSMLRSKKWSWLKAWAMQIARRPAMKKPTAPLARPLSAIMHR